MMQLSVVVLSHFEDAEVEAVEVGEENPGFIALLALAFTLRALRGFNLQGHLFDTRISHIFGSKVAFYMSSNKRI